MTVTAIKRWLKSIISHPALRDINTRYAEMMHYPQADRLATHVLWLHALVLLLLVAGNAFYRTPLIIPSPFGWRVIGIEAGVISLIIGAVATLLPIMLYPRISNHFIWRLLLSTALLTYSYLFVFVSGGAIEMHFHLFIIMAFMSLYADWRVGWYMFSIIAFNHLIFNMFWPDVLYFYGRNDLSPLLHLPFIFIMAVFTTILCRNYRGSVAALVSAKNRNDEFLAIASHELKTPLTSMKGYTEMLHRKFKRASDATALSYVDKLDDQLNKIIGLVRDLLDISRIQSGQVQIRQEMVSIEWLVEKAIDDVQSMTHQHHIEIVGDKRVMVYGDKARLSQLLVNLLSNAIKYSPEADRVIVSIKAARDRVVVEVQDFGIGISVAEKAKIFEPYFRGQAQQREEVPGGLGMGLYICDEIVRRHQGRLWVESAMGKGSTFSFLLPLPPRDGGVL